MLQAFIMKRVASAIIKKVMEKRAIKKMQKYVEKPNELDIQMTATRKKLARFGETLEEVEKEIATLKKDSHPPQEFICCRRCGCEIAKTKQIKGK
jgi:hypothetical protein